MLPNEAEQLKAKEQSLQQSGKDSTYTNTIAASKAKSSDLPNNQTQKIYSPYKSFKNNISDKVSNPGVINGSAIGLDVTPDRQISQDELKYNVLQKAVNWIMKDIPASELTAAITGGYRTGKRVTDGKGIGQLITNKIAEDKGISTQQYRDEMTKKLMDMFDLNR